MTLDEVIKEIEEKITYCVRWRDEAKNDGADSVVQFWENKRSGLMVALNLIKKVDKQ